MCTSGTCCLHLFLILLRQLYLKRKTLPSPPLTSTNYKNHSIPGRGLFNWTSSLAEAASPVFAFLPFLLFLRCLQSLQHRMTNITPKRTLPITATKFQGLGRKDMKSFSASALSGTWKAVLIVTPGGGEGVAVTSGKGDFGVLVAGSGTTQEKIRTAPLRQSRNVTLIYQYTCTYICNFILFQEAIFVTFLQSLNIF